MNKIILIVMLFFVPLVYGKNSLYYINNPEKTLLSYFDFNKYSYNRLILFTNSYDNGSYSFNNDKLFRKGDLVVFWNGNTSNQYFGINNYLGKNWLYGYQTKDLQSWAENTYGVGYDVLVKLVLLNPINENDYGLCIELDFTTNISHGVVGLEFGNYKGVNIMINTYNNSKNIIYTVDTLSTKNIYYNTTFGIRDLLHIKYCVDENGNLNVIINGILIKKYVDSQFLTDPTITIVNYWNTDGTMMITNIKVRKNPTNLSTLII